MTTCVVGTCTFLGKRFAVLASRGDELRRFDVEVNRGPIGQELAHAREIIENREGWTVEVIKPIEELDPTFRT